MLVIKHVYNMYDCFSGVGYDTHSRIRVMKGANGKPFVELVAGQRLPKNVVSFIVESLDPKAHYQKVDI